MREDVRNKIKKLIIYTKRKMQNVISGDYISAFKGSGLEFDQIREYSIGDDIRFIDWNSSAKMNKMMVKQFIEERDRTVILVIDVSASSFYSSREDLRVDTSAEVAAALSYVAMQNKDRVGALFFSDQVERWIPPARGHTHFGKIIDALFTIQPKGKGTDMKVPLQFLAGLKARNSIVFMVSDWIDEIENYRKYLKLVTCKYDFIGVRLLDRCEYELPDIGYLAVKDPETGEEGILDLRKNSNLSTFLKTRLLEQRDLFRSYKIDLLDLMVGEPFVNELVAFFHRRIRRQI
jgi:uncharacterized protein (DUF58 family)